MPRSKQTMTPQHGGSSMMGCLHRGGGRGGLTAGDSSMVEGSFIGEQLAPPWWLLPSSISIAPERLLLAPQIPHR